MVRRFVAAGGNFIDTADVYSTGVSEEITGRAIKDMRDEMVLATKVRIAMGEGPNDEGLSRKHILKGVEDSLRRLGTDYIDLYQCHAWDFYTPVDETMAVLDDLVRAGKIRAIGVSNWDGWQVVKGNAAAARRGSTMIASNQVWYNLADRAAEDAIIPACRDQQITIIAWGVLAQGFLSGRYGPGDRPPPGSRFELAKAAESSAWSRLAIERNWAMLGEVQVIARERGTTVPNVATRWLLQAGSCDVALLGGSSGDQFRENLEAMSFRLSAEEVDRLRLVSEPDRPYPVNFQTLFGRRDSPFYGNMR
jgi:aryl-alcohol dehydrogenase-like predicted oxidoreductase